MKIIYIIVAFFALLTSCSSDHGETQYFLQLLPVESIDLPKKLVVNQSHFIPVYYKLPTNCHTFDSFFYEKKDNIRTIAVQSIRIVKEGCQIANQAPIQATLNFKPTEAGMLTFKVWKGKDASGLDVYQEYEVPVTE